MPVSVTTISLLMFNAVSAAQGWVAGCTRYIWGSLPLTICLLGFQTQASNQLAGMGGRNRGDVRGWDGACFQGSIVTSFVGQEMGFTKPALGIMRATSPHQQSARRGQGAEDAQGTAPMEAFPFSQRLGKEPTDFCLRRPESQDVSSTGVLWHKGDVAMF